MAEIHSFQILSHLGAAMIGSPVPTDNEPLPIELLTQILDKDQCPFGSASFKRDDNQLTRIGIDSTILGLAVALIEDRNRDALMARSPHISTRITSTEVTFIDIQDDHFLGHDLC
jgi:hypothetical protein